MNNKRRSLLVTAASLIISAWLAAGIAVSAHVASVPSPTPMPRSIASPTPTGTPVAAPSPVPTTQITAPIQTIDDLRSKILQRLLSPEVRRGRVGIKIVALNTGKVIFENDADKYFMPASNMKNFTMAAAMERLTPDYRIVTSVFAGSKPDTAGTIKGDLRIYGRGDVSISTAFNNGDYFKGLDNLADKIVAAGVKRVDGSLVADESYFKGLALPGTWEWDDLQWYYGAEISALPLNDNAVDLSVSPGSSGGPCVVTVLPTNALMKVVNLCTTSATTIKRDLQVNKPINQNLLEIVGSVPVGDPGYRSSVTFTHPADLFIALLKQRLELKGVVITGGARTLPANVQSADTPVEITRLESPRFAEIAAKTLKPSQNMYTETILWTLGEEARRRNESGSVQGIPAPRADSSELGLREVKAFLKTIGIPDDGILQYDGSGLSRHDLITPSAVVTLYEYMAKQSKYSQAWRDALSIGGVDGTLSSRFKGTAAAGNIRGKTGTIDQVSALSGYMTTSGGEPIVLSIVVNGVPVPRDRTRFIDDIVVHLANYNGKLDK